MLELNKLYLMDCMEGMTHFPDKYFELAIVDPPYGSAGNTKWRGRFGGRFDKYKIKRTGGAWASKYKDDIKHWDVAPEPEYFDELFRVSKHQIIWGGNYFDLPPSNNFIIWRKLTISESFTMAMAEYAWTNIPGHAKVFECVPQGNKNEVRFHPTQKPVRLYQFCLDTYAKPGDKILDTHVGSASSLVACYQLGFDFCGFEIDADYHAKASERLSTAMAQGRLFDTETQESTQGVLL